MTSSNALAAIFDIELHGVSPLMFINSRTVSILINFISEIKLEHLIHFNNTDNSLHQANIGILYIYIINLKFTATIEFLVDGKIQPLI